MPPSRTTSRSPTAAPDGQPRGYAIDILNIIAQNTGLRFAPLWARNAEQADQLVQSGGPASAPPCRWRAASRRATAPACRSTVRCGAFTLASTPTAFPRSDLAGKRIGVLGAIWRRGWCRNRSRPSASPTASRCTTRWPTASWMRWWITSSPPTLALSRYSGAIKLAFAANNILPGGLRRAPRSTSSVGDPR